MTLDGHDLFIGIGGIILVSALLGKGLVENNKEKQNQLEKEKSALVQKVQTPQSFSKPQDVNGDGLADYVVTNDDEKSTFTLLHYKNSDGSDYFVPGTQKVEYEGGRR
jgi:hypothetical protein